MVLFTIPVGQTFAEVELFLSIQGHSLVIEGGKIKSRINIFNKSQIIFLSILTFGMMVNHMVKKFILEINLGRQGNGGLLPK